MSLTQNPGLDRRFIDKFGLATDHLISDQQDVLGPSKVRWVLAMLKGNGILGAIASLLLSSFSIFTPFI